MMKATRFLAICAALLLSTLALAQSEVKTAFNQMKTLAGEWEGPVTMQPAGAMGEKGTPVLHLSLRVTSRGNAIVHEFQEAGTPLDPTKYDHPVTMMYIDGDHLSLVHYCDAGNRPHMVAVPSADGKNVEFALADLSGSNQRGHMDHAVFTFVDGDHHIEDWTYMMPGDKPMHAHFELHRVK
jgi:hypothetical protein